MAPPGAVPRVGVAYFDQRERQQVRRRLVQRLERLGYAVTLQPTASEPPALHGYTFTIKGLQVDDDPPDPS